MNINELQTLDEALNYLNEGIREVKNGAPYGKTEFKRLVSNLLKKTPKNQNKKKSTIKSHTKNNHTSKDIETIKDEQKIVFKILKECLNEMKKDSKFKDECAKSAKKFNDAEWYNDLTLKDGYIPDLIVKEGPDPDIIEIINDYQMVCVEYSWILYWLADKYNDKCKNDNKCPDISFSYGDGDEGCLYVNEWC